MSTARLYPELGNTKNETIHPLMFAKMLLLTPSH